MDISGLVSVLMFIIIPKIILLDFIATNLRFGHIHVDKIVGRCCL